MGADFLGGSFPGGTFLEPLLLLAHIQNDLLYICLFTDCTRWKTN